MESLKKRLQDRGTETEDTIQKRLDRARTEMKYAEENPKFYDIIIENDDLETAYETLKNFLQEDINRVKEHSKKQWCKEETISKLQYRTN